MCLVTLCVLIELTRDNEFNQVREIYHMFRNNMMCLSDINHCYAHKPPLKNVDVKPLG